MMIGSCSFFISLFDDLSLVTSFAETLRHILCLCGKMYSFVTNVNWLLGIFCQQGEDYV
uniref:Uncharacterized protein n=1 Tax=Anguilla anguilla TaxID=7936 RepID=A0A0E9TIQ5_ANGAN